MEQIIKCPICSNDHFTEHIQCKDHFLSKELFAIVKCDNCGLLFTNPKPEDVELGKYYKSNDYLSHSTNRKGLINNVYNIIRSSNHRKKYKIIIDRKPVGDILDIGCATGEFLAYFKKKGWKVAGVEPNADARSYAKSEYGINVLPEEEIPCLGNNSFDVITLWHVLEHVSDLDARMRELYSLLRNDGILIIAVPNSNCYDAAHYKSFWAGYDVPRHLYHFDQNAIRQLFKKYYFSCTDIIPMKYDSYYVSLLSEKYISGKNKYLKAIINGMKSNIYARKNENNFSSLIFILKKEKT